MNKTFALAASFTAISLLAGCASTGAPSVPMGDRSYSESNSRAYNLAQAAGLHEARDTKLDAAEYSSMMSNLSGGAGTALSLSNSAGFGLSSGTSLGIGLASALFAGPGMMGRDSAFAFVPAGEASSPANATQVIRRHFREAAQQVANNSQFELEVIDAIQDLKLDRHRNMMVFGLTNEEMGCLSEANSTSTEDVCTLSLYYPNQGTSLRDTPRAARASAGDQSYQYYAGNSATTLRVVVNLSEQLSNDLGGEQATMLRLSLMESVSEAMPSWFYIYEKGNDYLPPMILADGQTELFVTQQ